MSLKGTFIPAILALSIIMACASPGPKTLDPDDVHWATYTDSTLQYSLEYPDVYTIKKEGDDVVFQYEGRTAMQVVFVDEETGRRRGLWFSNEPSGEIQLGTIEGQRYVYDHYHGLFYSRTITYAVPYKNKYIGLEFRKNKGESLLDEVELKILASFKFTAPELLPE